MDRFFEFLNGKAQGKLIALSLVAFGGICFVVIRKIVSISDKGSMHKLIRSLKSKPELAKQLSASLDIPYNEKNGINSDAFNRLGTYLGSVGSVGRYTILFTMTVDPATLLVLTELTYVDYDINVVGTASDTLKRSYHRFVLTHHSAENKMIVLSNLYSDTTDKFQKEEFLRAVFKGK